MLRPLLICSPDLEKDLESLVIPYNTWDSRADEGSLEAFLTITMYNSMKENFSPLIVITSHQAKGVKSWLNVLQNTKMVFWFSKLADFKASKTYAEFRSDFQGDAEQIWRFKTSLNVVIL
jgi:hypothetical protein